MLAIGFVVAGGLCLFAVLTGLVGPVRRGIDTAAAELLGRGRAIVPIAFLLGAVCVLAQRTYESDEDDEDDEEYGRTRKGLRLGLGLALICATTVALLYLGRSHGPWKDAGGAVGAGIGAPLRAGLGTTGAVIVLIALGLLGVLLVIGTGTRQIVAMCARAAQFVVHHARDALALPSEQEDERSDEPEAPRPDTQLFDQFAPAPAVDLDLIYAEIEEARAAPALPVEDDDEEGEHEAEYEDDDEYEDEDEDGEYDDDDEDEYEEEEDDEEGEYAEDEDEEYDENEEDEDEKYDEEDDEEYEDDDEEAEIVNPVPKVNWKLPALSLLKKSQTREVDPRLVEQGGDVLEATMREFGVDARLIGATVGPTVTRYELELAPGVKVSRVTNLTKEIAYSMASHDVRILAPIPGRSAIGVEVPNKARPLVTLGDILASDDVKKATHPLDVAMGRDIAGRAVMSNLATFPHVLIAGQTGAGKSSCINSIVTSLLMRTTPNQV